jgi:tripartite-type tricarboxylate transporter receptor subunit TctC
MKKLFLMLLVLATNVFAQVEIPLIVPYDPGGTSDKVARVIAKHLSNKDYNFVVTYKTGAGGLVASNYFATVKGTQVLVASNNLVIAPIFNTVRYDINKFIPINFIGFEPTFIVTNTNNPTRDLKESFKTGNYSFATAGVGTSGHLLTLVLNQYGNFIHVPYKGAAPVIPAILNNDVYLTVDTYSSMGQHIESGKVTPIAIVNTKRLERFPNIKTLREYKIDDTGLNRWFSLIGSEESDSEVIDYIRESMKDRNLIKELSVLGLDVNTSLRLTEFLKTESRRVSELYERVK